MLSVRPIWYPRYACPTTCSRTTRARKVAAQIHRPEKNLSKKEMSQDERLMTATDQHENRPDRQRLFHPPPGTHRAYDGELYRPRPGSPLWVDLHEGKAAGIAGDLRRMLDEDFHYRLAMRLYSGSIRQAGTEEKVAVQRERERCSIKLETVSLAQTVEILRENS